MVVLVEVETTPVEVLDSLFLPDLPAVRENNSPTEDEHQVSSPTLSVCYVSGLLLGIALSSAS